MKRIKYENDTDFYNFISIPRQQFARLRDANNTLSKKTVLMNYCWTALELSWSMQSFAESQLFFTENEKTF